MRARVYFMATAAALLAGSFSAAPARAEPGDSADEGPFGQTHWTDPDTPGEPAPLDIEIERDGKYFWRGQIDGNGGSVHFEVGSDTCEQIIVVSYSDYRPNPLLVLSPPIQPQLDLRLRYHAYDNWPARFEMDFTYQRAVADPNDSSCTNGVDVRSVSLRPHFTLEKGKTIVLKEFDGFRITVSRP